MTWGLLSTNWKSSSARLDHYLIHLTSQKQRRWEWDDSSRSFGWKWCDRKKVFKKDRQEPQPSTPYGFQERAQRNGVVSCAIIVKSQRHLHHLQHVLSGSPPIAFLPKQEYSQFSHNLHHASWVEYDQSITSWLAVLCGWQMEITRLNKKITWQVKQKCFSFNQMVFHSEYKHRAGNFRNTSRFQSPNFLVWSNCRFADVFAIFTFALSVSRVPLATPGLHTTKSPSWTNSVNICWKIPCGILTKRQQTHTLWHAHLSFDD